MLIANQIPNANSPQFRPQANGKRQEADQDLESIGESAVARRVQEDHTIHRRAAAIRTVRREPMEAVPNFEAVDTAAASVSAAIRAATAVHRHVRAEAATTRATTATERRRRKADAWACSACV